MFANFVIASFPVIMKNGYTIDILYPEYEKRFGTSSRPAYVRVVDNDNDEGYRPRYNYSGQWTCYLDGVRVQGDFSVDDISNKPKTGIFILRPQNRFSPIKKESKIIKNKEGLIICTPGKTDRTRIQCKTSPASLTSAPKPFQVD